MTTLRLLGDITTECIAFQGQFSLRNSQEKVHVFGLFNLSVCLELNRELHEFPQEWGG